MVIRQIRFGRGINTTSSSDLLHECYELIFRDRRFLLKRYGSMCGWTKLTLEDDGKEVYRVELKNNFGSNSKDNGERREFFLEEYSGFYVGNQVGFVEYVTLMARIDKFPTLLGLKRWASIMDRWDECSPDNKRDVRCLDSRIIDFYEEKVREVLEKSPSPVSGSSLCL